MRSRALAGPAAAALALLAGCGSAGETADAGHDAAHRAAAPAAATAFEGGLSSRAARPRRCACATSPARRSTSAACAASRCW